MNNQTLCKCTNCNKKINRQKIYNSQNHFCSVNCRNMYLHKTRDPKGSTILKHVNDLNFYYLIGWICTDGDIGWPKSSPKQTSYYCKIGVTPKDKQIIEDIQKYFGGIIYIRSNIVIWILRNKEFVDFLRNVVNIDNKKTLNLNVTNWFKNLTKEQKYNFIRGCWDGDGCIGQNKKTLYWYAGLASCSFNFLEMVGDFLKQKRVYNNRIYDSKQIYKNRYSKVKTLNLGGSKLKNAFKGMYKNVNEESLSLQRKHNLVNRMLYE